MKAPPEGRRQPRTHLFVAATLYADGGSLPVHIRNMSQSGALVEAPVLPDVGMRVALKRGPLQATGHIAWRVDRKAGVRLDGAVHVADWMARLGSSGQQRVDALLSVIRSDDPAGCGAPAATETLSIEAELALLRSDLIGLGAALTGDAIVVATHPEIQAIDIGVQRIDRVLRRLKAKG